MTDFYVAALGLTRAEDLYVCFRRPVREDGVCWPLPWAGTWSEAEVVDAAADLNNGVDTVAVPRDAVHALATTPSPGRIEGDVGPVVRNSATNRRTLVVAARRDIARLEAFEIPRTADAARGDEAIFKALDTLRPLLGRSENIGNDHLWQVRAGLLAALRSSDDRLRRRAVRAVSELARAAPAPAKTPQRPVHARPEPGPAQVAILRRPAPSEPPQPPSPDMEVGAAAPDAS